MEPIDPPPCAQEEDATQHSIVLLAHDVVGNSTEGEGQHHKHVHSRPPSRGPMTPNRSPVIIRHTLHRALELCRHASLCQDCILNGDLQGHEASCNVDLEVVASGPPSPGACLSCMEMSVLSISDPLKRNAYAQLSVPGGVEEKITAAKKRLLGIMLLPRYHSWMASFDAKASTRNPLQSAATLCMTDATMAESAASSAA
eukprot:CAMPEP_0115520952 /NCGR_PEP_ID=MMETSP0271-20121206/79281_1 /TAXON_ID=71861 /ORGANISM="Scrippsiella trochoidea, Strain CCMP3099" /LENGTH=199 /DNA_ID=CAMNT_0002952139 /DNA_START=92 /DNA_END=692 /DNA_ORIENTATION=+